MLFYLKFFLKRPNLAYFLFPYYNIPRKIRELQSSDNKTVSIDNYNIPRKIRELQSPNRIIALSYNYNIPRKIRELQFESLISTVLKIITYQEKLGNYNLSL